MSLSSTGVSIVIPNFNYGHHLGECLNSLLAQTHSQWEAIVVDNFSSDDSEQIAIAAADPRIRFVKFSNGGVIARSRNFGVGLARYPFVAFLDSDDFWHPEKLKTQLNYGLEDWDLSYHNVSLVGNRGGHFVAWDLDKRPFEELLMKGNPIVTSSVLLRKSLFVSVGGFPEGLEFVAVEDYFLWLKLSQKGSRFIRVPEALASHRIHESASGNLKSITAIDELSRHFLMDIPDPVRKRHIGFTSYDKGMRYLQNQQWSAAVDKFFRAVRFGSWRYRWRGILRAGQALLLLSWSVVRDLLRLPGRIAE